MSLKNDLERIEKRIEQARARSPYGQSVKLLAVTKTHPLELIEEAYSLGLRDFGENKVQELTGKMEGLGGANWHLIGHLQTNKAKYVAGRVFLIHSVDSEKLAAELERQCEKSGLTQDVLVQVNAAGEQQKSGISPRELRGLCGFIKEECPSLRLRGLMEIAPAADDPEAVRPWFRQVKSLFDELRPEYGPAFDTLSMGMSGDFETAIEEGATMVRIGTALFGERDYSSAK